MSYFAKIASLIETISLEGKYQGRTAKVFLILGRRAGFTSTSNLNDVADHLDTSTARITDLDGTETLEVVSSSAADVSTDVGASKVKITYINASNVLTESAEITLNGTTPVATGITAKCLLWMEVTAVGTGTVAQGNIVVRSTPGAVPYLQITAGGNKSLSSAFMVPTGYTAYLISMDGSSAGATTAPQDLRLRATVNSYDRSISTVYHFQANASIGAGGHIDEAIPMLKLPALARVKMSTLSGATTTATRVDTSYTVILIAD